MKLKPGNLKAPECIGLRWVQGEPRSLKDLEGQIVLLFFFDYSNEHCLRVLSYLKIWHGRYVDKGLEILAIHTPEFDFGADKANVRRAVEDLGIPFSVALDPESKTWDTYANRHWPALYLIDKNGYIFDYQFGEGGYFDFETSIQACIKQVTPRIFLPRPIELSTTDDTGALVTPITPNIYFGYRRGRIGNPEGFQENSVAKYILPEQIRSDVFQAEGFFLAREDMLVHADTETVRLVLSFDAAEVYLIAAPDPTRTGPAKLTILQDGNPLSQSTLGRSCTIENGQSICEVWFPNLYHIVKNDSCERRLLEIQTATPGARFYCATFTTES